jgi:sugar/nucleoside kinase (ribokinase family)
MSPSRCPERSDRPAVLCAGIAVADVIVHPIHQPLPVGQVQLVDEIQLRAGGCALSTATALRALGVDVGLSAAIGEDAFGDFLLQTAEDRGIDRGGLRRLPYPTSASVVAVDHAGERTFLHVPGCNDQLDRSHVEASLHDDLRWFHLAGLLVTGRLDGEPAAELLHAARRSGARTSADVVWDARGGWERMQPCLEHLDLFSPNADEALALSGRSTVSEAATWLHDHGVRVVAITCGERGARVSDGDAAWYVAPFDVFARDGTGAGDAYAAGLIYGFLAGWSLPRTAAFASVLGGLATTVVGAPTDFPDLDTLVDLTSDLLDHGTSDPPSTLRLET